MIKQEDAVKGARVVLTNDTSTAGMITYGTLASVGLYNGALGTVVQDGVDADADVLVRWDDFENPVKHPSGQQDVLYVRCTVLGLADE